jgi:integrase
MTEELVLTRDNCPLSRPNPVNALATLAINCTTELPDQVREYVQASLAENTRRAYVSDLEHFRAWGGRVPATDVVLASYLAAHAGRLSVSTLSRRLAAIAKAHGAAATNPGRSPLVKATMRGIMRRHRQPPRQAKPLLRDQLFDVLTKTGVELRDVRDRALLLVGFAGGFRRSELVGLDIEDIEGVAEGLVIRLRQSKTDQCGFGREVAIPYGHTRWCPVVALHEWLLVSGINSGALFRRIDRHDHLLTRLSGEAVSLIVKARLSAAGMSSEGYSGHSLRAGFATSAAQAGLNAWDIRRQTGHASTSVLATYVRHQDRFSGNPVSSLL